MEWTWRFEDADGIVADVPGNVAYATQSEAESWLGENWRSLAADGLINATLLEDGRKLYGPMPLSE